MWFLFLLFVITAVILVFLLRKQADQRVLNDICAPLGDVVAVKRYTRNAPADSPYHAGQGLWVHRAVLHTPTGQRVVWVQTSARLGYRWCFDDARDQEHRIAPEPRTR
jgi:hypothetical protein